ncbi:MAG: hypothetical protein AABX47_08560 [Nanoarchaeota archaeon]
MNSEDRIKPVQLSEKIATAVKDRMVAATETASDTTQAMMKSRLKAQRTSSTGWNAKDQERSLATLSIDAGNAIDPKPSNRYAKADDRVLNAGSSNARTPGDDKTNNKYPGRTEAAAKTMKRRPSLASDQKPTQSGRPGLASMTCRITSKT